MSQKKFVITSVRILVAASALAGVVSVAAPACAEDLKTMERRVVVTYPDGAKENYVAVYTGVVNMSVREEGGPAKPFEGHFVDDRRCHWAIENYVRRQVFQVNRAGHRSVYEPLTAVFASGKTNQGSGFMLLGLRSENCNDAADRRNSDLNDAKNAIVANFQATVDKDSDPLKAKMQSELQGSSIAITQ